MYGRMTPEQLEALPSIIQGRHLLDLGSGDLERARLCLSAGAASITCIDPTSPLDRETPGLLVIQRYAQWAVLNPQEIPPYDMVLLGWPNNNDNPSPALPTSPSPWGPPSCTWARTPTAWPVEGPSCGATSSPGRS